ncbi:MAG: hypothetical protein N2109_00545 [Fimbriimonadales bacterium]|nr:hypothetical protein [Fimbriimonadales bacterium]
MKLSLWPFLGIVASACSAQTPGTWAFDPKPDGFSPAAAFDLRSLNERVAGESGYVRVDANGDFVLGNGKPVRFWCVNTDVGREKPFVVRPLGRQTEPDLDRHARFLAKRGVNMVRAHTHMNPKPDQDPRGIDEKERDWVWRLVAAMKKQGIYTTVSPYWAVTCKIGRNWGIEGGEQDSFGLLFFDEKLQEYYKGWLRQLLAPPNPYTGVPLAKDPALAIFQLQNEDSLLFWTANSLKPEQKRKLGRKFAQWAAKKYGSLPAARQAWGGFSADGDDWQAGVLGLRNLWELTQPRQAASTRRLSDQLQFVTETMRAFNAEMVRYLREELGCKALVNPGNWTTADNLRLMDAERWSYTAGEVLAVNRYLGGVHVGPNEGWAIQNGDKFTSDSVLRDPAILAINLKQVVGRPMLVTESAWVMPNGNAAEGPFLVAAYSSLSGVDGYYWFATGDDEWTPPQSANGYNPSQKKWTFGYPDMLGQFPAAALLYRMGYVKRGDPVVREQRPLEDIWAGTVPVIAEEKGFDPNRMQGAFSPRTNVPGGVNPLAYFAGPVTVEYGGDPSKTFVHPSLKTLLNGGSKVVRSVTGELSLDYGKGLCTLDAPKAQGAVGWFAGLPQPVRLSAVTLTCQNRFASILAVSLDDKPLAESRRVLVQVGTRSRPTDWQERAVRFEAGGATFDGFEVVNYGRAPWRVESAQGALWIRNPHLTKATLLDENGMRTSSGSLTRQGGTVRVELPKNSLYLILEAGGS